jgi:carbon monoxide dehydrogenase subunit G
VSGLGGTASGEIDAPIDEVWAVVTDVATIAAWQDGIVSCTPIETNAAGEVVRADLVADAKVKELRVVARFERSAPTRLSWVVESGDVKKLDGSWTLEDLGDGRTRATYETEVDPGRMLRMMVRGPIEDKIREKLVARRPAELGERVAAQR